MQIEIILDPCNTDIKEDINANITATIHLNSIWDKIQPYNRFFVLTSLVVPVTIQGTEKTIQLSLRNHFYTNEVDSSVTDIIVLQQGYIEGIIPNIDAITSKAKIWVYDLSEQL
ncbi:hypothetical protein lbkm_3463 [Lachnospiraceae bacterium KM106-2]|nr:hypothetical protein lbkm_3463 [Lachnospiraceae bacterium KM106-2]